MNFSEWSVNIVAEAIVKSEPAPRFPVVLNKEPRLPHAIVGCKEAGTAGHAGECADKEGRQIFGWISGISGKPELISAIGIIALDFAGLPPDECRSSLDCVLAKGVGYSSVVLEGVIEVFQWNEPAIAKGLNIGKQNKRKSAG